MAADKHKPAFGKRFFRNFGLGAIATLVAAMLVYFHNVTISEAARLAVEKYTVSLDRQLKAATLSMQLTEIANQLHDEDSYTKEQRDNALDMILNDVPQYAEFIRSGTVVVALERVVGAFVQARQAEAVAQIDKKHRSRLVLSDHLIVVVTELFGASLLSSPDAPNDWNTHSRLKDYVEIYETYSIWCKEGRFPELYLLFQMLMEDTRGRHDLVGAFVHDVAALNEGDAANLAGILRSYVTGEFTTNLSDSDNARLICRTRDFYVRHVEALKASLEKVAPRETGMDIFNGDEISSLADILDIDPNSLAPVPCSP